MEPEIAKEYPFIPLYVKIGSTATATSSFMVRENTWHGYSNGQKQVYLLRQRSEVINSRGEEAMTSDETRPPKVFISYSHDSQEHADRVLELSDHLRADGIDCILDQYEESPPEGFPVWMDRQIRAADFVLMICTPTYFRRVMREEEPGKGHGVAWESTLIYQYIYNAGTSNTRFIPVLLEGGLESDIPVPWQGVKYYRPMAQEGYEELYRRLTGQPLTPKPALGTLRMMQPRERKHDFSSNQAEEQHTLVNDPAVDAKPTSINKANDAASPRIWSMPFTRNPYFTGRDDLLTRLHTILANGKQAALSQPQAISGLGGIGKTQTAIEYAYRYRDDYNAIIWLKAESRETLLSDVPTLAQLLNLPQQADQGQEQVVEMIKDWFQSHTGWLLIFDNADDLAMIRDFLPAGGQGHILLTTRSQVTGNIAKRIDVERMVTEEGTLFLLHRAGLLDLDTALDAISEVERAKARELIEEVGGLPLALDQAGAYIEETQCGLAGYLQLYRTRQAELLKRRGRLVTDHPDSVDTTWSLSFEKVERANPVAADLLRLCAFLDPDVIPEELITKGASELGHVLKAVAVEPIRLNEAIADVRTYSLLRRNPDHTLTIHRLVQAVLKQGMNKNTQRRWAERAVRAVNQAFPEVEYSTWLQCQHYMPQVQTCAALIDQWGMTFPETAQLLMQAGNYLVESAQYAQAEPLYLIALAISEKMMGPEHSDTASTLHNLADLYEDQGKYEQAEPLYQRALAIREKMEGPEHPNTATTLHELAILYWRQGKYEQAEPLLQRALAISEKTKGPEHPDTAATLHQLAVLYADQGKYEQAEPLYQRALAIFEKILGPEHPDTGTTLHALAVLYVYQGKYEQAEPLMQRALAISEKMEGPDHPSTADTLYALAVLYWWQDKYEQAEPLMQRALAISEKVLGPDHPNTVLMRKNYANLFQAMK
jgi:tetratricopeptide (TPR) repeat protein